MSNMSTDKLKRRHGRLPVDTDENDRRPRAGDGSDATPVSRPPSSVYFQSKRWGSAILLSIFLYFMYSSTFLLDYLMNDEWSNIGMRSDWRTIINVSRYHLFAYGRPLIGVYLPLVYGFIEYDPFRVQVVRFFNFLSMTFLAILLLKVVERQTQRRVFAFGVVLFFFSLPAVQGLMGYSVQMFASAQPALWFSMLAFYFYFYLLPDRGVRMTFRLVIAFVLLLLAMQSSQSHAFFAMVPLTFLALTDWSKRWKEIALFFLLSIGVWAISALAFKLVLDYLHAQGKTGYALGEQAMAALLASPGSVLKTAFNPLAYWSAFKIWTYPFPFHSLAPLSLRGAAPAGLVMAGWGVLVMAAFVTELNRASAREKRQIMAKWLSLAVILGFAAMPIIADSPTRIIEHRPHITFVMSGVIAFSGAYSLLVLAQRFSILRSARVKFVAAFLVLMIAFGAQAGVLRGITVNRMEQLTFIRNQLMAKDPRTYQSIIVVLPNSGVRCMTEPCDPWIGQLRQSDWHLQREGVILYAMSSLNIPKKTITFVKQAPDSIPEDAVLVDWNVFVRTRERLANALRR